MHKRMCYSFPFKWKLEKQIIGGKATKTFEPNFNSLLLLQHIQCIRGKKKLDSPSNLLFPLWFDSVWFSIVSQTPSSYICSTGLSHDYEMKVKNIS